jgi:hypothetical protein
VTATLAPAPAPPGVRVPPLHIWTPPRATSAAAEVIDLARDIGRPPDAEQQLALDCLLSETRDGKWAALTAAIVEARQNGKTAAVLLPAAIHDLWIRDCELVIWTAHLQSTADKAFADLCGLIAGSAFLSRRVKSITSLGGSHTVKLIGGAQMDFIARSGKQGRGFAGAESITLDEALFVDSLQIGALMPTMSTGVNPQMRLAGSAGLARSVAWREIRDRGRRGAVDPGQGDPTLAYVEWGAERRPCRRRKDCSHRPGVAGCSMDDRELWQQANHTMRSELVPDGRIGQEFIAGERGAMDPAEYGREILSWWDEADVDSPVNLDEWAELGVTAATVAKVPDRAAKVFLIDVSPDSRSAAIVMAARMPSGRTRLEVVDYRPGAAWVVAEAARLKKAHRARVVLVRASPAGVLIGDLISAGVDPFLLNEQQYAEACGMFLKACDPARPGIEHLQDPLFAAALGGAVKKLTGDGMWKWARAKSSDICVLVAGTLGPWALANVPGPGQVFAARA